MSASAACDVIVIGGGVIGLSIAWEVARTGAKVRVLDQGLPGQEASWAGAGILPPGNPDVAATTESRLRAASHRLWADWSERIRAETGIENGFHRCGGVGLSLENNDHLPQAIEAWRAEGVVVERLDGESLRDRVSVLNPAITSGFFLPELGQVRNPRHLKGLLRACQLAGVDVAAGNPVVDLTGTGERLTHVRTPTGEFSAAEFVVASGAWSRTLLQRAGYDLALEPVRGQIVLLETRGLSIRHVLEVGPRYLVPRSDGRLLIGSTEERAGFEKRNTAGAIEGLVRFARELVPALSDATVERCWAGLRPHLPGGLPQIGRVPGQRNLTMAAGHFRAGLQLSPQTAILVRQLLRGESLPDWATALAPGAANPGGE